jgi:ATP-dependent Lhr-like helicase
MSTRRSIASSVPRAATLVYYTFAGNLVNRVVALTCGSKECKTTDVTVTSPAPLKWDNLLPEPQDHLQQMPDLFQSSGDQSIYQRLLPLEMQAREFGQEWLKGESVAAVLRRLAASTRRERGDEIGGAL